MLICALFLDQSSKTQIKNHDVTLCQFGVGWTTLELFGRGRNLIDAATEPIDTADLKDPMEGGDGSGSP